MKVNKKPEDFEYDIYELKDTLLLDKNEDTTNVTDKLNSAYRSMLSVKSDNVKVSQKIIQLEKERILKNMLMIQIEKELDDITIENKDLKSEAEQISKIKQKCEYNRNQSYDYCTKLKKKLNTFVDTINEFETKIMILKKERDMIIKNNQDLIVIKTNEIKNMKKENENIDTKISHNADTIVELDDKLKDFTELKENEKRSFTENEENQKKKYEDLKRRYENLILQSQDYEREVQTREIEVNNYNRLRNDNVKKVQDLKIEHKEYEIQNQILKGQVHELSLKLTSLTRKIYELDKRERLVAQSGKLNKIIVPQDPAMMKLKK